MNDWPSETWRSVIDSSPDGVVICDAGAPDCPVVYVNASFAQICGYAPAALIGANPRILQGTDRQQESRQRMRESIERCEPCRVLIRNYRPDGSLFWNEVQLQPLRNAEGKLTHWIGYAKDAGGRMKSVDRAAPGLPAWQREDRLTGLYSRPYFEELLRRDWQLAQRDSHPIGLVLFDIDDLSSYNEKFEKTGGDACIRRVARVISSSYRRGGDLVGHWEGGTFVVVIQGEAAERASEYARVVAQRARDLLIHHPRNGTDRYVTVSAGVASLVPPRELPLEALINACRTALQRSKRQGKNTICTAEAADFQ
ncbi:MAG TPA: diguanylate cyclase [Steroidobacteraceae bacterium]|jgi:diguanylate cyclase (GGDEF)-like protein/PAS domain S-box-containing protein|nr:diguanylate cyclase [Steroidobacteraceae bacterium]